MLLSKLDLYFVLVRDNKQKYSVNSKNNSFMLFP